jgi:hypothetical protein
MPVRPVALVFGIVFVIVAVLGFVTPGGMNMDASLDHAPRLMGLFPVNVLHSLVHLVFGLWGLIAARGAGSARAYCRGAGTIYLVLAALGFVAPTGFGLVPIGGNDIWLHASIGLVLAIVGFAGAPRRVQANPA